MSQSTTLRHDERYVHDAAALLAVGEIMPFGSADSEANACWLNLAEECLDHRHERAHHHGLSYRVATCTQP